MDAETFLRRCVSGEFRIVNSGDLSRYQIAEAQAAARWYVDPATSYGWALLPWTLSTERDKVRELEIDERRRHFEGIMATEQAKADALANIPPDLLRLPDDYDERVERMTGVFTTGPNATKEDPRRQDVVHKCCKRAKALERAGKLRGETVDEVANAIYGSSLFWLFLWKYRALIWHAIRLLAQLALKEREDRKVKTFAGSAVMFPNPEA